jgi:hypothetical protein
MAHPRVLSWHDHMEHESLVDQMYVDDDVSEAMGDDESWEVY